MLESIIAISIIVLDRLTKIWASGALGGLAEGRLDLIPGFLEFIYVENTGAAFSMLTGKRWFFVAITFVIVIIIIWYLVKHARKDGLVMRMALSLILGGAVYKRQDRIFYGYVIDFINPSFVKFAVFNISDMCVTCGTILLVLAVLFMEKRTKSEAQ